MNEIPYKLLLLMASLTELTDRDRILAAFTDAINSLNPAFSIVYQADEFAEPHQRIPIMTAQRTFGAFRIKGEPQAVSPEFPELFQKCAQMLALVLEKIYESQLRNDDAQRMKEAENDLIERETNFRTFFNTIHDFLFILDEEGSILEYNDTVSKRLGYAPEELLKKSVLYVHPEDRREEAGHIVMDMLAGICDTCPVPLITRTGELIPVETSITRGIWNGKPALFGVSKDISALKFSEEKFSKVFYLNPSACGISHAENGQYIEVNDAFYVIFGFEKHEVIGKTASALGIMTPEARQSILQEADARGRISNFETTLRTKSGKMLHVLLSAENIVLQGRAYRYTIAHDITERKRAEEALRASERKLSTLFEAMTEMVVLYEVVLNEQGEAINYRITDCNQAFTAITGIRKEDAVGRLASDVYQVSPAPYLSEFSRVGLTGEPFEYMTYYAPMDKHFMISVVSPQHGQFATVTTDITAHKQMQEAMAAKNKELENYLYVASHDLRSPLVNIQGFSQRLQKQTDAIKQALAQCQLPPEIHRQIAQITETGIPKTLDFIFTNVTKMDTLIKGLLQISRTGRVKMTIQRVEMNALIANVLRAFAFQLEDVAARVMISDLPACYGDEHLLNQLFANVIGNALKYRDTRRPLTLTITAQTQYHKNLYSIRDNGIGIALRHLEKIWDVFYRVDSQAPEAGEGIGLSIVKRITDKHKGKIWVESEEGQGSVFYVELPNHEFSE